jgi:riboflavin synthase
MFTGIIEKIGKVVSLDNENTNLHITVKSDFTSELKVDQSVAHNGVCLTVVGIDLNKNNYTVTAIKETLDRTNLSFLKNDDEINLERCTQIGARLDGHIVQGHVDTVGKVLSIENVNGSWNYSFEYNTSEHITVAKGSITINGVSLTVVNSGENTFSVSIIPYTYEHTNFKSLKVGSVVNLEFDIIGKYVSKLMNRK